MDKETARVCSGIGGFSVYNYTYSVLVFQHEPLLKVKAIAEHSTLIYVISYNPSSDDSDRGQRT